MKSVIKFVKSVKSLNVKLLNQLKVQSCKLLNNKYIITSIQITNPEIFAFIVVLVFKLLTRKVLLTKRKDRNCQKVGYFLGK